MKALRDIPGVRVEVNADFDSIYEETTRTVKPDPKTAVQSESTTNEQSTQAVPDNGGRPGYTSQGPNRQPPSPTTPQPQNENKLTKDTSNTINAVGVDEKGTIKKNFDLKEVWASVAVPSSYLEALWKARNPTATEPPKPDDLTPIKNQVKTNVEEIVEPLLTLQQLKGQDQYKHVRFVVMDSLPAPVIAPPSFASTATSWVGRYWGTLGMLGVAMFSLLVLRSVVNAKPGDTDGAPAAAPGLKLHTDEPTPSTTVADEAANDRPRLRLKKGNSLKDDLVEIVREDPDAAADILRSWIAKAG
jgi:flagellar M-ring protein FliF